jgi:hypothetical protein
MNEERTLGTWTQYPDSELLNAACLIEKQHISILQSFVCPDLGLNACLPLHHRDRD